MTLHFSDGISLDTSGPLRILLLEDGLYVIGRGNLIPVGSHEEALAVIEGMTKRIDRKRESEYIDFEEL